MEAVVSTRDLGKTPIVLYFFRLPPSRPFLFDLLGNDGLGVTDDAFFFRVSIIDLLDVFHCGFGDLPPIVSSFSAKSMIGLKFLSVSFTEMVPAWPFFSDPTYDRLLRRDSFCRAHCQLVISQKSNF